ncbi:MAG: PIN domain-containing protein [Verrucomicrobiae bacterium]|nr:PIN domain-containing protein [Verrucomicrobiae bacterium]
MTAVFIDTGAFLARLLPKDQHHLAASRAWDQLAGMNVSLVSSEAVLLETANFLTRAESGRFAAKWLKVALDSQEIRWLHSHPEDFIEAADYLQKFSDQRISLTDALSMELMRQNKIRQIFSFDRHFPLAGFSLWTGVK